ncbi:MAG: hypothetical protein AB1446_09830 [Bacillota bacterium]
MRKRLPAALIKAVKDSLLLLVILYFTQSIWLVPLRLIQGEHWRVFPGRVVDIAACDGAVVVAGESEIWGFDRELRARRFKVDLARTWPGPPVQGMAAAKYWPEDGLLCLVLKRGRDPREAGWSVAVLDTPSGRLLWHVDLRTDPCQVELFRSPSGFVLFELDPDDLRATWYDTEGRPVAVRRLFARSDRRRWYEERAWVFEDVGRSGFLVLEGRQALLLGYGGEEVGRCQLPVPARFAALLEDGRVLVCGPADGGIVLVWLGPGLEANQAVRLAHPSLRFVSPAGMVAAPGEVWVGAFGSDEVPIDNLLLAMRDEGRYEGNVVVDDMRTGKMCRIPLPAFLWYRLNEQGEVLGCYRAEGLERVYRRQIPPPLGWLASSFGAVRSLSRRVQAVDGFPGWEVDVSYSPFLTGGCSNLAYVDASGRVVVGRRFTSTRLGPGRWVVSRGHYYRFQFFRFFSLVYHLELPSPLRDGSEASSPMWGMW